MMIRNLITRYISEKKEVRVYCHLGKEQYGCISGVITDYGVRNDAIRMADESGKVTLIPLTSIHSITLF